MSYGDFLSQCVHYDAPEDAIAGVELAFEHILNGVPKTIRVQRTWTRSPKGGKDALDVTIDDWPDDVLVKTWDEWIETMLPLGKFHRVIKQVCNIERFQVRTESAIRTHCFYALQAFCRLQTMRVEGLIDNLYQVSRQLFVSVIRQFILQNLEHPSVA